MLALTCFKDQTFAVFGLGKSGLAACEALQLGGAKCIAWEDNESRNDAARGYGYDTQDLKSVNWDNIDGLILSPGVPLTHPRPHWSVELANQHDVPVIGDIDLFYRQLKHDAPDAKIIAITGTNGKSTTTALITHLLRVSGHNAVALGNIGTSVFDTTLSNDTIFVIECSSYQIDLSPHFAPDIALLLNISPDHLDRHGTLENYANVKAKLLIQAMENGGTAICSIDDPETQRIAAALSKRSKGTLLTVSHVNPDSDLLIKDDEVVSKSFPLKINDFKRFSALSGRHNHQNLGFAALSNAILGIKTSSILTGLSSFPGLSHRMERVGHVGSTLFVNDSKATNADASERSLQSYDRIYWICGGQAKEGGIVPLLPLMDRVVHVFLIGAAAEDFATTLQGHAEFTISETMENAVSQAAKLSVDEPHENVVLLAPACASWDQFTSFEARGDRFKELVTALDDFEPV